MASDGELELQVRLLCAGLGLRCDDPAHAVSDEVLALARGGETVEAVRLLRQQSNLRLLAAKKIVDAAAATAPA